MPEPVPYIPQLRDFRRYCPAFWRIHDKLGQEVAFRPNPAQRRVLDLIDGQRKARKPVRIRVLKARQEGISTLCTALNLHGIMTHTGYGALSIADKQILPQQWIRRCHKWYDQVPTPVRPHAAATNAIEIYLDKLGSRYYIGSAEGTTPGMGDTLQSIHCSEIASWPDPDSVLSDLLPALPPGPQTMVIQESTGRSVGDWWYQRYYEAKRGETEYQAIFLPWFIQDEYRREDLVADIIDLTPYEQALVKLGCDKAQLAWRRFQIRTEFHGNENAFANQFPALEEEAFLSMGLNVFMPNEVAIAKKTIREPIGRFNLDIGSNPTDYKLVPNESGNVLIWEHPDPRYHYVLGADCQWGTADSADYDSLHVECLETRKVCCKAKDRLPMYRWGKMMAALGHYYNTCPIAPERNAVSANNLMPLLLGNLAEWHYPNVWIRSNDVKLRGYRPEDYGWYTDKHTKGEIIEYAHSATIAERFDWCDADAVEQMTAYVMDPTKLTFGAPEGQHDDDLMSRMITAYVAHRERTRTTLYFKPEPVIYVPTTMADRIRRIEEPDEDDTDA